MTPATDAPAPPRLRFSFVETLVFGAVVLCGVTVLFPMMAGSRDRARGNLCKYNLRQLDLATLQYLSDHQRLPGGGTWPVELLPQLHESATQDRLRLGTEIFTMPRPRLLNCPAHPNSNEADPAKQWSLYVFVIDRVAGQPVRETRWRFQDREAVPSPTVKLTPWFVGIEADSATSQAMVEAHQGPHPRGQFFISRGDGQVDVASAGE